MEYIKKYKNIFLVIGLIVVAFFAYRVFFGVDGIDASLLISDKSSISQGAVGQDLLQLINTLNNLELDESIFTDPVFRSLDDLSQDLTPEPSGRNNPFAPISTNASISNSVIGF